MWQTLLHSRAVHGALVGWISTAAVDYQAFRTWKSVQDALKYDWSIALWRWLQGAVLGAVSNSGIGAVLG
jgi:hypothetical protein